MAQRKDTFFLAARSGKKTERPKKETFKKRTEEKKNDAEVNDKVKKPFDKKAFRFKKYSNKYKLDKWEDQRKKRLLKSYYKDVKNNAPLGSYKPVNFDEDVSNSDEEAQSHDDSNEKTSGMDVTDSSSAGRYVRHPDLMEAIESVPNLKCETEEVVNSKSAKKNAFQKAKAEMERLKLSKEEKKKESDRSKQEREQKLNEYRKKKAERFKKLSRKTKKGQPVMTGRLELLLEKIVSKK